ncbi:MAG: flagellar assembly protein FliW [Polyangiaceae bacterium]|nr:flagellar assembly protein FliW [Polyangiaceae bacterium]
MIRLENTRFGSISIDDSTQIAFPRGLIGFSTETRFVLIERDNGAIAYLQSLVNPAIALPVIDAAMLQPSYPLRGPEEMAQAAGIEKLEDMLALVVLAIDPADGCLRANLLAPIVIDASTRTGAQILLDADKYGASVPIDGVPAKQPKMPVVEILNG